jgi:proline iminopeptidase
MERFVVGLLFSAFFVAIASPVSAQAEQKIQHPHGEFVTIMGKKIWYESAGEGQPLLLIPGAGGSHDYFHPFFTPLERSFRVIYFDGYGRGNSERGKSPSEYTFDRDLDEIEALRQALHLGKIIVYGHSYGGFVAQAYALKYPDSVSKLVVSNIFTCGEDYQASNDHINGELQQFFPELWEKMAALHARGLTSSSEEMQKAEEPYFMPTLEFLYFYNPQNAKLIAPHWNEREFSVEQWKGVAGTDWDFVVGGDLRKLDFRSQLGSIKVPFLVVAGLRDGIVLPRLSEKFKTYAPQAKFVMFEKSGHYPFIEENALFIKTLEGFLK